MNNVDLILEAIRSTREISFLAFGNVKRQIKNGNPHDVVTELDKKVEKVLKDKFFEIDPEIGFVGEEFGGERDADKFWLVDPIDGTNLFVRGLPFCTTMVALVERGNVVFSAIYDFVSDVMYHAELGKGAFANGEQIFVSQRPFSESKVCLESKLESRENVEVYAEVRKYVRIIQLLCSGYEHALVASGKIEGRMSYNPYGKDYDFAPGTFLIKEAGGVVKNIGSDSYDYTNLNYIACTPEVYKGLVEAEDAPKIFK